jgi:hypothetical protein
MTDRDLSKLGVSGCRQLILGQNAIFCVGE